VAHSGPTSKGSYVQTLTLTDTVATGWTECAAGIGARAEAADGSTERDAQAVAVRSARVRHGQ